MFVCGFLLLFYVWCYLCNWSYAPFDNILKKERIISIVISVDFVVVVVVVVAAAAAAAAAAATATTTICRTRH